MQFLSGSDQANMAADSETRSGPLGWLDCFGIAMAGEGCRVGRPSKPGIDNFHRRDARVAGIDFEAGVICNADAPEPEKGAVSRVCDIGAIFS
ncbi:hypothetical protein PAF20_03115 [Paracoccus albus]|nr:hypothetical protein [Paracoccus albus]WBU60928.1 hypothetical protein PAF20_03115 [Paracoccus albus]